MSMQRVRIPSLILAVAALLVTGAAPPGPPPGPDPAPVMRVVGDALGLNHVPHLELPAIPAGTSASLLTPPRPPKPAPVYVGDDLSRVAEASLESRPAEKLSRATWEKRKALATAAAIHLNAREQDGYLKAVLKEREDLAGLPFVMGKDCRTDKEDHFLFTLVSGKMRPGWLTARLAETLPATSSPFDARARKFDTGKILAAAAAGVAQIMGPVTAEDRVQAAEFLARLDSPAATRELARMAVYSPDEKVRAAALKPLAGRPAKDYAGVIGAALSYPWPAVARNAADAAVKLRRKDLLPELVGMLEADDPRAPVKGVARELVRINHHHNCLLCHAPATDRDRAEQTLVADIPLPYRQLPQTRPSEGGYGPPHSNLLVRIDVTYLRQDFSAMQRVETPHAWPYLQRFDFVVRKRTLNDAEAADLRKRLEPKAGELSPYRQAALDALRRLTGRELDASAAAWRKHLGLVSS